MRYHSAPCRAACTGSARIEAKVRVNVSGFDGAIGQPVVGIRICRLGYGGRALMAGDPLCVDNCWPPPTERAGNGLHGGLRRPGLRHADPRLHRRRAHPPKATNGWLDRTDPARGGSDGGFTPERSGPGLDEPAGPSGSPLGTFGLHQAVPNTAPTLAAVGRRGTARNTPLRRELNAHWR